MEGVHHSIKSQKKGRKLTAIIIVGLSIYIILPATLAPMVYSASNKN
jgi:hypothetical protein